MEFKVKVQRGFTLIELISVLLIVSVVAGILVVRAQPQTASLQSSRDQLVAAFALAQQTAMVRDSTIAVTLSGNSVAVTESGAPMATASGEFPFTLPSGVQITQGQGTYVFNKRGDVAITGNRVELVLARDGAQTRLTLEGSGYVHW